MPSPESNLLNTSLEQLKKQEEEGRVATEERMTRLLYHIEDLERRLSYLESVMDEQLEGGSQISSLTNSTVSYVRREIRCMIR